MYTHTHTHTDTCTHTHTHTCTYTQTHVHTHRHMYTHTHMYIHTDTCTIVHAYTDTGYCTLGGGREHSTHSLLCFHCAQLLSSLMAPSANDRSGLSSEPAQQDGTGGHTRPHHSFHSPLASR
ncbi:unnamed protein product [Staurois parvus]|uniref:Uncharacterized protein n=1 Tax=Staurois parvus TaxID=386267 RepID=A0ABN9G2R6_9NEOB|nr:unnamed protein product [Staurois parvus]